MYMSSLLGNGKWKANPIYSPPPAENKNLKKTHFVVKAQIGNDKPIYLSNKDKSFSVVMKKDDNEDVFKILTEKISAEGFYGEKGYFHLILEAGDSDLCQFRINPYNIFEESW